MAATPQFASSPRLGIATISTANTNLNGSGTLVNVVVAGSSGTKINEVTIQAAGTVTSGMVRLFVFDGTTNYLSKFIRGYNLTYLFSMLRKI